MSLTVVEAVFDSTLKGVKFTFFLYELVRL